MAWVPARFDTVRAFRVEQRAGGMTTRAWIDAQGHIVRAENAVGFAMERTAFELAYTNFRHRDTTSLIRASLSPGPGEVVATTVLAARQLLPHDTVSQLRVRLTGVTPGAFDLGGGRQQQSGDTLLIRREPRATLSARYQLPARDSCPWTAASTITRGPRCTLATGWRWTRCSTNSPPAPRTCGSASAVLPSRQSSFA